jgi:hypothetical protein
VALRRRPDVLRRNGGQAAHAQRLHAGHLGMILGRAADEFAPSTSSELAMNGTKN